MSNVDVGNELQLPPAARAGYSGANVYIGARIEERRQQLDLSQQQVAMLLNVTEQQLAKYERGVDVVPPAVLKDIASTLTISIAWFFFGLLIDISQRGEPDPAPGSLPAQSYDPPFDRACLRDELNHMAWSLARQALAWQAMTS